MAMITCVDERHHISTCNPEGMQRVEGSSRVANFILWWFFFQRGGFLHSADAQGLNDISGGRFYGFAYCFYNISRRPAALIRLAQASQLPPREALVPCRTAHRLNLTLFYPEGPPERHTGRSLRFHWCVVPFNRTGYTSNVAGGIIAAPTCVVLFNPTGYIRNTADGHSGVERLFMGGWK